MIRYSRTAIPWRLTFAAAGIVAGLIAVVGTWPWFTWPLQGTALGVVAGAIAWAADEPSASVVDTLPRPLWWRTVARAAVVPVIFAVWFGGLVAIRRRIPDHLGLFALQGTATVAVTLAVVVWRRSQGVAEPGRSFATIVVPTATAFALARPLAKYLPLFPVWPEDRWDRAQLFWIAVLGVGLGLLFANGVRHTVAR